MNKVFSVIIMLFIICISGTVHASLIRYDITAGYDVAGYDFSGYVYIESNPVFEYYQQPDEPARLTDIRYTIGQYEFISQGGRAYGDSGYFYYSIPPEGSSFYAGIGSISFCHTAIENYIDMPNAPLWTNGGMGVWFEGSDETIEGYSSLAQEIRICSILMSAGDGGLKPNSNWGPYWSSSNYIILTQNDPQPVPEPATFILLGAGLLGLMGFKRKMGSNTP